MYKRGEKEGERGKKKRERKEGESARMHVRQLSMTYYSTPKRSVGSWVYCVHGLLTPYVESLVLGWGAQACSLIGIF